MDSPAIVESVLHTVERITARTGTSFDRFVERFEIAVPPRRIGNLDTAAEEGDRAAEYIDAATPSSFRVFSTPRAVSWLFGNAGIAGLVVAADARALLYAPMRLAAYDHGDREATIAVERPSDGFNSLERPETIAIGRQLDAKLADLLDALGVPAAAELLRASPHNGHSTP
ncbi:hypothetical protein [Leifsonia sp. NPDC077715]|uniref:hypothetical protein n=1 Tax=Leifsonia sp. NPDC077715 TaxID=3155539 RepID=UPI0034398FA4